MATYRTTYPGNSALEDQQWTLTLTEAASAITNLDTHIGSYWHTNLVRPHNRAKRNKVPTVRVYTAGFSTAELSNALCASGMTVEREV